MADETQPPESSNPHPGTASTVDMLIAGAQEERRLNLAAAKKVVEAVADEIGTDQATAGEILAEVIGVNDRFRAIESVLRRILAEPQLLGAGDPTFIAELRELLDGTPPPAGVVPDSR